jgi:LPXTG-site transpeptidase (sortase) family protein
MQRQLMVFGLGLYGGLSGLSANKQVAVQVKCFSKVRKSRVTRLVPPTKRFLRLPRSQLGCLSSKLCGFANESTVYRRTKAKSTRPGALYGGRQKNELQAPYGIYDAGWYNASSHPGENGAMLIDGHSGIGKTRGIFHDLTQLAAGDDITVTRGDGQTFTYKVVDLQVVDKEQVDMGSLLVSADTAKPGLTLITCAGSQVPGTFSLQQRVIVRAVMQ